MENVPSNQLMLWNLFKIPEILWCLPSLNYSNPLLMNTNFLYKFPTQFKGAFTGISPMCTQISSTMLLPVTACISTDVNYCIVFLLCRKKKFFVSSEMNFIPSRHDAGTTFLLFGWLFGFMVCCVFGFVVWFFFNVFG